MAERTTGRRKRGGIGAALGRHKEVVAVVVLLVVAIGYTAYALLPKGSKTQYVTSAAQTGTLILSVSGTGNTVAAKSSSVDPGISGTVSNLRVGLGSSVKKGQILFSIVNADLGAATQRAYASYQSSKTQVEQAEIGVLQAKQNLYKLEHPSTTTSTSTGGTGGGSGSGSGSGSSSTTTSKPTATDLKIAHEQVDVAESQLNSANNSVDTAWTAYTQARDTAAQRTVRSPITGVVTTLNVINGGQLGSSGGSSGGGGSSSSSSGGVSSSTPMVVTDLSTMRAQIAVNEVDLPNLKVGQKATTTFDALPDLTITGKVSSIDQVGTNSSGVVSYNVTISFDLQDKRIKPGMSCSVTVTTSVKNDVLLVPNAAVHTSGTSSYVTVLQNGTPQQVTVQVGGANDTSTEIVSGLKAGQAVVTQTIQPNATTAAGSATSGNSGTSSGAARRATGGFGVFGGGGRPGN